MNLAELVGGIVELAKADGNADKRSAFVYDGFKGLALNSPNAAEYEKSATNVIVAAGVRRKLWSAGDWVPAAVNGVFCWTKDGQAPVEIALRSKKLPDGTAIENNTENDKTHKACVAYAGAVRKFLASGGSYAQLEHMGWNELCQHNKGYDKEGQPKVAKPVLSAYGAAEKATQVLVANGPSLTPAERSSLLSLIIPALA